MNLPNLKFHRKHQDDLDVDPILCVHAHTPNTGERVFCLWPGGVQLGGLVLTPERVKQRLLRRPLNTFAKSVMSTAKQRGLINNDTMHEIAGIIDRRLWPERYKRRAPVRDLRT